MSVSPGSAPSMKNGPVSGLSPLTSASGSPGFLMALPKQSSEFASRMFPSFRCATGAATPNTYFTLSIVARYGTTSGFDGADCACVEAESGRTRTRASGENRTRVLQESGNEVHHTRKAASIQTCASAGRHRLCYPLPETMKNSRRAALRIVSLAPSATSILCAIGARKSLVGVTKWCPDVAPVGKLPTLGDCWHMESVEDILRLKPTLVIGSVPYKQETVAKLLEHPLNFLAMNPRTLADIENDIRLLGGIANRRSDANRLVQTMRAGFAAIAKRNKRKQQKVRVYCEAWPNPRISSPPWVAEVVSLCGGEMVLPPGEKVTVEEVASAMPDV